jgi:CheY-like chemotaxis protein
MAQTMPTDGNSVRIAVIDDEKMLLSVFSSLMRQFGFQADFFSNPVRALDAILSEPGRYQLIISDIRMPEMDGITFAKKVRFVLPKMPIIFMTGEVTDEMRQDALAVGNVEFLEKPFPLEATLRDTIPRLLAKPGA